MAQYKVNYTAQVNSLERGKSSVKNSVVLEANSSVAAEQIFNNRIQEGDLLQQIHSQNRLHPEENEVIFRVLVDGVPTLVIEN